MSTKMMSDLQRLWQQYNEASRKLEAALGGTGNLVAEYSENLALIHYGGTKMPASFASFDIKDDNGARYQIKARRLNETTTTQLGIIRSWDFDYLVIFLFDKYGTIHKVIEAPTDIAKLYAKENKYQSGFIITTTTKFLSDRRVRDITEKFTENNQLITSKITTEENIPMSNKIKTNLSPKITKKEALEILNINGKLNLVNFSNINKVAPCWWIDVPAKNINSSIHKDIIFILYDNVNNLLYKLEIPLSFLQTNRGRIKFWEKKTGPYYSFRLSTDPAHIFMNMTPSDSRLNLKPFLVEAIDLNKNKLR